MRALWRRPSSHSATLSLDGFVEELKVLGLAGACFDPPLYANRLSDALKLPIHLRRLEEVEHPLLLKRLEEQRITGGLFVRSGPSPAAWVVYPEGPCFADELLSQFHELGHLAGDHLIPPARLLLRDDGTAQTRPWSAPNPLAVNPCPEPGEATERDAELRAEYSVLAGFLGAGLFARNGWTLGEPIPPTAALRPQEQPG